LRDALVRSRTKDKVLLRFLPVAFRKNKYSVC